jgi:hypothetical protein
MSIQAARAYKASASVSPPSADGYRSDRTKGEGFEVHADIPDRHVVMSTSRRQSPSAPRRSDPCVPRRPGPARRKFWLRSQQVQHRSGKAHRIVPHRESSPPGHRSLVVVCWLRDEEPHPGPAVGRCVRIRQCRRTTGYRSRLVSVIASPSRRGSTPGCRSACPWRGRRRLAGGVLLAFRPSPVNDD